MTPLHKSRPGFSPTDRSLAAAAGVCFLVLLGLRSSGSAEPPTPLEGALSIAGTVTDERGVGVSHVVVDACDTAGSSIASTETAKSGSFRIDGLPKGVVVLKAFLDGGPYDPLWSAPPTPDARSTVRAGKKDVTLRVIRGEEMFVRSEKGVFDRGDIRRGLPEMVIEAPEGLLRYGAIFEDGKFVFRRVRYGFPWALWVKWDPTRKGTYYGTGQKLEAKEVSIALEAGGPIQGRVIVSPGRVLPRQSTGPSIERVRATRGHFQEDDADVADDGRFAFFPLATGRWTLSARVVAPPPHRGKAVATVEVEAGNVDVRIDPVPEVANPKEEKKK